MTIITSQVLPPAKLVGGADGHRARHCWRTVFFAGVIVVAFSALPTIARAQPQRTAPRIAYVYPAGGQQGATFTISIGGQNLNGTTTAFITGNGVTSRVVGYERPLAQREITDLREQQQKLQEKRIASKAKGNGAAGAAKPVFTAEDEKRVVEIRQKLAGPGRRGANPGLAETVTLELTLSKDAPPGDRELRIKAASGLSNPFTFSVSQLPETSEPVVTPTSIAAPRPRREVDPRTNRPRVTRDVKLPAVVNGQILPGEVDRYRFNAKKDQRLTVVVAARALIPFLADAVPGWFQATAALHDSNGREVAYEDDFRFNPDPVLAYVIPADGDYTLEIKDSIYRGREDFVYRVAMGELPFVTSIFPLGCAFPERGTFELSGWNLPSTRLAVETKDKRPGTFVVSVRNQGQFSNRVRFALDAHPETLETEPNNAREAAQSLNAPMIVNGRIERPGDRDVFRVEGAAGATLVAEVFARRLNSPLDSVLTITDASGKVIASNDDYEDKGAGLTTHHADSRVSLTLPAPGTYFVEVADTQHHGGAEYGYRLRIAPPQPDFELRVTPATINAKAGMHVPISVYALRRDGFAGDIMLGLRDAPRGFGLSGARIPAGQDMVHLTLYAGATTRDEPIELAIVGQATIAGRTTTHAAVPAEDMMQAFAYHHLVPMQRLMAQVSGRGAASRLISSSPVRIPVGGSARIELETPAAGRGVENIKVDFTDPPPGVAVQKVTMRGEVLALVLTCDPATAKIGTRGNLLMQAAGERKSVGKGGAKKSSRVQLGSLPAIPFEIVAATPARST
ncbi:MAG: PPC domain-containing protein [Opitutaceae bacterium]|nr:PPC domain-containing protein [Opitutaceae bacterium]